MIGTLALTSLVAAAAATDTTTPPPGIRAAPLAAEVVIGGRRDEAIWREAPPIRTLLQSSPDEGAPATEAIEVRFAADDAAIYVGAGLFDRPPDSV